METRLNRKHFLNLLELKVSLVFMMTLVLLATLPSTARTATTFGPEQIISLAVTGAQSVFSADIDGDGDDDAVSAALQGNEIAWHENVNGDGSSWTKRVIAPLAHGKAVFAIDIDGDGDIDVVSAAGSFAPAAAIRWHENNGAVPPVWTTHTIQAVWNAGAVWAGDIDGDGDIDVASTDVGQDRITWHENNGAVLPGWTNHIVASSMLNTQAVAGADIDGDGDIDLLSGTVSANPEKVSWFENGNTWAEHQISPTFMPGYMPGFLSVHAVDIDADGDIDVLAAGYDITVGRVWLWKNTPGSPPTWSTTTIRYAPGDSVFTSDLDGDGDPDIITNSRWAQGVTWYENTGTTWPAIILPASGSIGGRDVFTGDLDGDGEQDILAASSRDSRISWYENAPAAAADSSDLSITKTAAPNPVETNAQQTFTLAVTNNGPDDATGVTVVDTLPAGMTFVSASAGCVEALGVVTCSIGNLSAAASAAVQIIVTAPANPTSLSNTAVVAGLEIDPDVNNNSATENIDVEAPAPPPPSSDLAITKTATPDPVEINAQQTFTLAVTNNGPDDATGVTVVDNLPAGMTFVSASSGCSEVAGVVTCSIGGLSASASTSVQIVVTAPASPTSLNNTASVNGVEDDPDTNNNSATCNVDVVDDEEPIPTLSEWGTIILIGMLALVGVCIARRRQYT